MPPDLPPFIVQKAPTYRHRRVLDRATRTHIGHVCLHQSDDLWYLYELYEDGGLVENASGRALTMRDAAEDLHHLWATQQADAARKEDAWQQERPMLIDSFHFDRTGHTDASGNPVLIGVADDCNIAIIGNVDGWSITSHADGSPDLGEVYTDLQEAIRAARRRHKEER